MTTILYVYHASNIGGGSYAMLNVIKALDRSAYRPVVLLKRNGPLADELKSIGVEVHFLPTINTVPYNRCIFTLHNIKRIVNICRSFGKFASLLKRIKPDIVYLNTMMLHPYLRVIKKSGIKSIIHIREHWPEGEHTAQRNYAIKNIRKYADKIVAINTFSASMVADATHHPTIVYDWINMDARFKETPYDTIFNEDCSNKKVYLCTGGFDANKGTLEIIQSFTEIIKNKDARLLVLGNKPTQKATLYSQQVIKAIEQDSRVKLLPNTYFVTHIYQQAYCMLSYFTIPHANLALAESIILQTPVIAARNEESIEYSHNGELAILFEANNIEAFKKELKEFDNNCESLKSRLIEKSLIIEKMFNPQINIENLNKLYKDL